MARGESFAAPSGSRIISRRKTTGGLGNLGLAEARARLRRARVWGARERRRFDQALRRLAGRAVPPYRPLAPLGAGSTGLPA